MRRFAAAWARLHSHEEGIALVLALLVLFVVAIGLASTIALSTSQSQSVAHDAAHAEAASLAESGLNYAAAILVNPANDPTSPSTLPSSSSPGSVAFESGTASYWGSYDNSTMTWTVYGKGTVRNPSATQPLTHGISERFAVTQGGGGAGAWQYIFAYDPTGCMSVSSSVKITQPLYVNGDLCISSSAQITSTASPVSVVGTIQTTSSSTVGTNASPIAQLHVGGGCRYGTTGSFVAPCTSTQHVYATSQDTTVPTIAKPTVDLAYWYAHAQPGPSHGCTSGSFPGGFDNNSALDTSLPSAVNLMPSTSYDCTVSSGGQTVGRIAWTSGNPGTLTIKGTVFFDGNISMSSSSKGVYSGLGTIYASGTISLSSSVQLCGAYASGQCDWTHWDPSTNMLILVAGSTASPDFTLTSSVMFQGGSYATTDYSQSSSVKQQGPIIANNITMSSSTQSGEPTIGNVPVGAPGGGYTVAAVPGTWNG